MRVVETEQVEPGFPGTVFGATIVIRPHQEAAARSFFRGVGKRGRLVHHTVAAQQGAAAFMRKGFPAVCANGRVSGRPQDDAGHQLVPQIEAPSGGFSQKRSDK